MVDPAKMLQSMVNAGAGGPSGAAEVEQRAKYGQLTYAAQRFADRGGCDCTACQLLRQAGDLLTAGLLEGTVAQGDHPQP